MENSFGSLINSASSVLILLPVRPYLDQVAAGLALYLAIRDQKDASISCPTPMTVEFNRLVGVNKVTADLGNKNMVIKFINYNARNIERISSEVEGNELYMVVIPNPGAKAPAKENVEISFSGVSAETIILVGGVNESHYPQFASKRLMWTKVVHIGTRSLALSPNRNILSFARPASSVSELAAALIEELGITIDTDIATNLLMGVEEGSRQFKGPDVTAETFELVARLLKKGGQRLQVQVDKAQFPSPRQAPPTAPLPERVEEESPKEPPKDWLEAKIYKGTSIS